MFVPYSIPFLRTHVKIANFLQCIPFTLNPETNRMVPITKRKVIWMFQLQCFLSVVFGVLQLWSLMRPSLTFHERLQGATFFVEFLMHLSCRWNPFLDIRPMQLINTFMDYEERIPEILDMDRAQVTKRTKVIDLMTLMLTSISSSIATMPLLSFNLTLLNPCTPPFILSLLSHCKQISFLRFFTYWKEMALLLFDRWMNYNMCYSACFGIFYNLFVELGCLLHYLDLLERKMNLDPEFDGYYSFYRQITVLEKIMNDTLKDRITPAFLSLWPGIQILAESTLLAFHNDMSFPAKFVNTLLVSNCFLGQVLISSFASRMYHRSAMVVRNIKSRQVGSKNYKELVRMAWASPPLRLKFGTNFVDRGTPLVLQDFCLSSSVSIVLIAQGHRRY